KMPYFTFVRNAAGLTVGDRARLMGFDAGEITEITAMPPEDQYLNVYIRFLVKEPYYGYLWEDSRAKVGAADFLGHRFIEVTKGTNDAPTYALHELKELTIPEAAQLVGSNGLVFAEEIYEPSTTNVIVHTSEPLSHEKLQKAAEQGTKIVQVVNKNVPVKSPKWIWDDKRARYKPFGKDKKEDKGYWLRVEESPALTERLEGVINAVEGALPDFLALTNKLTRVLTNAASIVSHADELLVSAKPVVTNFARITANLSGPKGSLGEWLLPTNVSLQLQTTLASASATMTTAQTNLNLVSSNLLDSLENVANLTSNLHAQVQANAFILTEISELIVNADDMVQGLKRHWLLKSAFGQGTNQPLESIIKPRIG